ncbi:helix-turn-helix domain-containing protein [Maribacter forsetii]|uniref:helix-turn-helix domain-containing protein n=1 Tax=Maribacter forsetii TaxID=444515 RepID=UPI000567E838|nr:helix-turn-helix domain-containing protein [Maribacter forsetii]
MSKYILVFCLTFLTVSTNWGQNTNPELGVKIEKVYTLALQNVQQGLQEANSLLAEIDDYESYYDKAVIYTVVANITMWNGKYDQGIALIQKAIDLIEGKEHDMLYSQAQQILAYAYIAMYRYGDAFKLYSNMIVDDKFGSNENRAFFRKTSKFDFGVLNSLIGRKKEALALYLEAEKYQIDSKMVSAYWEQKAQLYIANSFYFFNKKDSANYYYNRYKNLEKEQGETLAIPYVHWYEGNKAYYDADYETAIKKYNQYEKSLTDKFNKTDDEIQIRKARAFYSIGQLDSALVNLEMVKDSNYLKKQAYLNPEFFKIQHDIYSDKKDEKLADEYLMKYIAAQERFGQFKMNTLGSLYELKENETKVEQEIVKSDLKYYNNYLWIALGGSVMCFVGFTLWKQKREKKKFDALMQKTENKAPLSNSLELSTNTIEIKDEKVEALIGQIKVLKEQGFFLKQKTTLHNTAKKLKTNTSYLSTIINTHLGTTFSAFVNDIRIDYIVNELKTNKQLRSYSVKAIAEEIGYKSADSFSKYFKQNTGLSPSSYIKKLNKEKLNEISML